MNFKFIIIQLQEMKGHINQAEKLMHQALGMAQKDKNQQAILYIYDQVRHGKNKLNL